MTNSGLVFLYHSVLIKHYRGISSSAADFNAPVTMYQTSSAREFEPIKLKDYRPADNQGSKRNPIIFGIFI